MSRLYPILVTVTRSKEGYSGDGHNQQLASALGLGEADGDACDALLMVTIKALPIGENLALTGHVHMKADDSIAKAGLTTEAVYMTGWAALTNNLLDYMPANDPRRSAIQAALAACADTIALPIAGAVAH